MEQITGEVIERKWKIRTREMSVTGLASHDMACCGPVAVCAIEAIMDNRTNTNISRKLEVSDPRSQATLILKHVISCSYEEGLYAMDEIEEQHKTKVVDTRELCGLSVDVILVWK